MEPCFSQSLDMTSGKSFDLSILIVFIYKRRVTLPSRTNWHRAMEIDYDPPSSLYYKEFTEKGPFKYTWRGVTIDGKTTCLVKLCGALRVSPIISRVECSWARRKEPRWRKYACFAIRALPLVWRVISDKLSSLCLSFLPVNNHSL